MERTSRLVLAAILAAATAPVAAVSSIEGPAVAGRVIPEALSGQELRPLSLASADFDGDGIPDLAAGFGTPEGGVVVLYRGNADALYPHSPEARQRQAQGRSVGAPFLPTDRVLTLSAPPDFLFAGDFDADGRADLAAAMRGGSVIELHRRDSQGGFQDADAIAVSGGRVTALAAGDLGRRDGLPDLVAVEGDAVSRVLIYQGPAGALRASAVALELAEPAAAVSIDSAGAEIALQGATRAYRLERVERAWRLAEPREASPRRAEALRPDAAATLAMRVGPHAAGSVVLKSDGTLSIVAPMTLATLVVNATTDLADAVPGNGACADINGECSLRAAIQEANASPGTDSITFAIPGAGVPAISTPSLPTVTEAVTIDGTTQAAGRVAVTGTSNGYLLTITGGNTVVRGLVLNGTGTAAIRIQSDDNIVEGNLIGTTADGTAIQGDFVTVSVLVQSGSDNRIGGTTAAARNVIAGGTNGIRLDAGSGHLVQGNYIGTDVTGALDLGGDAQGVWAFTAGIMTVGGAAPGAGNVISGYAGNGIRLDTAGNLVQGNRVGTDAAGLAGIPNGAGINLNFSGDATVGGTAPGTGNLISGNASHGIDSEQSVAGDIVIQGNRIGLNGQGSGAIPNQGYGLQIVGGDGVVIGGTAPGARNVISGNLLDGIFLTKFITVLPTGTVIQGNFIGTDETGTIAVPNLQSGIAFSFAEGTILGGTSPAAANVISGNLRHGIDLNLTTNVSPNLVQGNLIGVNAFGTGPLGNGQAGVFMPLNTYGAIIGGTAAGEPNTIAFNLGAGIASAPSRSLHVAPNVIHSNGGLGHDLFDDGVTANRPGAITNNFPVLTLAEDIGGGTSIEGLLSAQAATNFEVYLFSSPTCDPSGHGEGRQYHKMVNVTTDGAGLGIFATTVTPAVPGGRYVTAYAVAPGTSDDSSEFSFCRQIAGGPPPEDVPLELFAVTPPRGGDTGMVTLQIAGQGMVAGATARLERSGSSDRVAQEVTVSPDGYTLTATFDLAGAAEGLWDVTVDIPGDTATLVSSFTVEQGTAPEIWADIMGRGTLAVRAGREQTFFLVYGNRGNTDAPATLLRVSIPWQLRVTAVDPINGTARIVSLDSPMTTGGTGRSEIFVYAESVPAGSSATVAFRVLTIAAQPGEFGEDVSMEVDWTSTEELEPLFQIPLNATVSATVDILVDTPGHFEATIHLSDGFASGDLHFVLNVTDVSYESDPVHRTVSAAGNVEHTYLVAFRRGPEDSPKRYDALLEGSDAAFTLARDGGGAAEARRKEKQEFDETALLVASSVLDASKAATLNDLSDFATAFEAIFGVLQAAQPPGLVAAPTVGGFVPVEDLRAQIHSAWADKLYADYLADPSSWNSQLFQTTSLADQGTPRSREELSDRILDMYDGDGADQGTAHNILKVYVSIDPNEKAGPSGSGDPRYITGLTPLSYAITFENLETASAPAQEVVVTDTLDGSQLDLATFELGPIAFGTFVIDVPPGLTSFTGDVDLRPGIDLIARVSADFNAATGVATWHFFSLDPATGQPTEDPILGFLPPNVATPEGEGHVSFFVRAQSGLPSGIEIHNQATIVFDANPPIVTADWFNTIDVTSPTSQVAALPASSCSSIDVQWSGADAHSGIASYDVLVSQNAAPFVLWLVETPATSAVFYGDLGSSYAFRSVARDAAGNAEAPGAADASTTVGDLSPLVDFLTPDSGSASGATVELGGSGFEAGAAVTVGGLPASGVTVDDPTSLTATFPALAQGALYDVLATNASACAGALSKGWFADFGDVPAAHAFHDFVEKIFRRAVTAGCLGGNYCPDNPVTRAQMAVFLTKAKYNLSLVPPAASGTLFTDVPIGSFAADWIEQLAKEGVTGGCGGGNYCPNNSVTRAQMAVFLLKSRNGALYVPPAAAGVFADVPPGDPFAPWIEQLAAEGITGGCGGGNYCPGNPVTRGQMAVFLSKTFGF